MKLNPTYIENNGKREYVVLSINEFASIQELLEDAEDILAIEKIKEEEKGIAPLSLGDVKKML